MATGTTINTYTPSLTSNDSAVLQALFDAESSPSSAIAIDPSLPPFPDHLHISTKDHESLQSRELDIIHTLQSEDACIESIDVAIGALDALIGEYPTYAPAYVNRAQALRMRIEKTHRPDSQSASTDADADVEEAIFSPANSDLTSRLLSDLGTAIELCTPRPADPVSSIQAKILAGAHTHRGYLLLKASRAKMKNGLNLKGGLRDLAPDRLEELASRDFFFGGRYGNKLAQQMAVQTNPYAKMCGAIVKEVLRKEVDCIP